ncbi:hypothetical protein PG991_013853 [Apiospora marii]|uniref:Nitrate/nitrite sensing protein domain-containing protein n=2 Tax=Apiospora marii TaxID=335849 RepID=A0ABR1R776_9PEZI
MDLDQQIAALKAAAEAEDRERLREHCHEIATLESIARMNARRFAPNDESANNQVAPQNPVRTKPDGHAGAVSKRTRKDCWVITLVLLLVSLLVGAGLIVVAGLRVENLPDPQLEATFQPHHDIADMLTHTRPNLRDSLKVIERAKWQVSMISMRMRDTELPDKDNISKDIDTVVLTMDRIGNRLGSYHRSLHPSIADIRDSFRGIPDEYQFGSDLFWYTIESVFTSWHSLFRAIWLRSAAKSSGSLEELGTRADGLQRDLGRLAAAINGIQQRMVVSQRIHEAQVKRWKSRWFYRSNIFASPIAEYSCEADVKWMAAYVKNVTQVQEGFITRRDVLAAASRDLASIRSAISEKEPLESAHGFPRRYHAQALSMISHLRQGLDCEW